MQEYACLNAKRPAQMGNAGVNTDKVVQMHHSACGIGKITRPFDADLEI